MVGIKSFHYLLSEVRFQPQPLSTTVESKAFLEACIIAKGNEKVFRGTEHAFDNVCSILLDTFFTLASVEECKRLHKRLNEQFRRNGKSDFPHHIAYLRGDRSDAPPMALPRLTSTQVALKKFTKGEAPTMNRNLP